MTLEPDWPQFRRQLRAWSVRGALCAFPSFCWAVAVGIDSAAAVLAMIAGTATYVLGFAWGTSLPVYVECVESADLGWSLRFAANVRAGLSLLLVGIPDMWLGVVAVSLVGSGVDSVGSAGGRSFGTIYVTTLLQGALVSATMCVVAGAIWGIRAIWRRMHGGIDVAVKAPGRDVGVDGPV